MSEDYSDSSQDDTRLCPVCRTAISVWATRCRFCGEEVGRPRREEAKKTIEDLGGVRTSTYTVSGNVKDALEAFRAEELAEFDSDDVLGDQPRKPVSTGLPELDAASLALADAVSPRHDNTKKPVKPVNRPLIDEDTRNYILGGLGLVVVIVMAIVFWPSISAVWNSHGKGDELVYNNRALEILESGGLPVEALTEAHEALKINDTPENHAILQEVRAALVKRAQEILNAPQYSRDKLDTASRMATRAVYIDSSPAIRNLKDEIDKESAAHQMILLKIDEPNQQATFRINNRYVSEAEQTVGVGDLIQDRFIVQRIAPNYVRVADTQRKAHDGPRILMCRELESVSAN